MSEKITTTNKDEVVYASQKRVCCDGPETSKHPKVYLTIEGDIGGDVVCPYCSRVFIYERRQSA